MNNPPHFKGFKPIGLPEESNPVVINYEEYESIRLSDFELNGQVEAAQIMGISRPTYARIYESARRKVAEAFVLGKTIVFEGGKVYFDSEWFTCKTCGCWFNHTEKGEDIKHCTLCGSPKIEQYHETVLSNQIEDYCVCPTCGIKKIHLPHTSCNNELCPECNGRMVRNGRPHPNPIKNKNCN
jgi:predicted DNA-binding protein (UPF0251 family)